MARRIAIMERILVHCAVAVVATIASFPIFWMICTSLKTRLETFAIPPKWISFNLANYKSILLVESIATFMMNSVVISLGATASALIIGVFAAYSFARFSFRGSRDLAFWILSIRMFPPIASIIPLYLIMRFIHLLDTQLSLVIAYTTFNLPFVVWMMIGFFQEIPEELEESAMIDGCSRIGAFFRVVLPLSTPGLIATSIFCFIFSWNEFIFALTLTSYDARTMPVVISTFLTEHRVLWGQLTGAATLTVIPVLVFGLILGKYLVRGLTLGAVKA